MRTLYFDCFAGISGDMTLGALVGAGADESALLAQLNGLGVSDFKLSFTRVDRSGISSIKADVHVGHEAKKHRHLANILHIIEDAKLSEAVKKNASAIFIRLGEAEARVHHVAVEKIHFHEVGAIDAIVDVVGACIGFELLGIERFVSSPLHVGTGTVKMEHGLFPVPPPAVAELLRDAPIYSTELRGELVTPTGAAIISTLCKEFGPLPQMKVEAIGYGAGTREYEKFPNVLRVMVGESSAEVKSDEKLLMIETNIDDATPQIIGHLMEAAFKSGALDCFFTQAQMKKNRPGVLVSILCRPFDKESIFELLFSETTTIGARCYEVERRALERELVSVETEFGSIRVKVARTGERIYGGTPEYDDCRSASEKQNVSLREVESAALAAYRKMRGA